MCDCLFEAEAVICLERRRIIQTQRCQAQRDTQGSRVNTGGRGDTREKKLLRHHNSILNCLFLQFGLFLCASKTCLFLTISSFYAKVSLKAAATYLP